MRDWLSTNLMYQPSSMLANTIMDQLNAVGYVDTAYKPTVEVGYKLLRRSRYMKII